MDEAAPDLENAKLAFEREKWQAEQRRLDQKEAEEQRQRDRDFALREREITFKEVDAKRARWTNPLALAIFAAAISGAWNAIVSAENNNANVYLEKFKAESTRILEVVKTSDPDKAARNLKFLLDAGLIETASVTAGIRDYLAKRKQGEGFSLPASITRGREEEAECAQLKDMANRLADLFNTDEKKKVEIRIRAASMDPCDPTKMAKLVDEIMSTVP